MLAYTLHIQDEFLPKALQLLSNLPTQSFSLEPIAEHTDKTLSNKQQRLIASQTLAQLGKRGKICDIISPIDTAWNANQ